MSQMTSAARRVGSVVAVLGCLSLAAASVSAQEPKLVRERWRAIYVGGSQMGYVRETVRLKDEAGRNVVLAENAVTLDVGPRPRPGRAVPPPVRSTVVIQTTETEDGALLGYRYENQMPPPLASTVSTARIDNGVLKIDTLRGRRSTPTSRPWTADVKGPAFADKLLIDQPLKANETRTIQTFDPKTAQVDVVTLVARDVEPVLLLDGTERRLLHVVSTHSITPEIEIHEFLDEAGESWKTTIPSADMVVYTAPREAVLKPWPHLLTPPVTPVTPAPVTPAPVTPAPVTPAPVTPAPVTPAPATPVP